MIIRDILGLKGGTIFSIAPEGLLSDAVKTMVSNDIGSLVVMKEGAMVGMLTFREVLSELNVRGGNLGDAQVGSVMVKEPITGNPTYAAPFDRPYDWTVSGNPVLQARTFGFFATDEGLAEIKTYADGIGPWKVYIIPTTGSGGGDVKPPTDLIQRAHAHGLLIHTWTFRDDAFPTGYPGGPAEEYLA